MSTAIEKRFFTASSGKPATAGQRTDVAEIQARVFDLAGTIDALVPDGRNKSLALTALEDVQMRANRAIFADEASNPPYKGPGA